MQPEMKCNHESLEGCKTADITIISQPQIYQLKQTKIFWTCFRHLKCWVVLLLCSFGSLRHRSTTSGLQTSGLLTSSTVWRPFCLTSNISSVSILLKSTGSITQVTSLHIHLHYVQGFSTPQKGESISHAGYCDKSPSSNLTNKKVSIICKLCPQ